MQTQERTRPVYRPVVVEEQGLCALLGTPHPTGSRSLWATVPTRYRADVRREEEEYSDVYMTHDFPPTPAGYAQAKRWAERSAADLNRNR